MIGEQSPAFGSNNTPRVLEQNNKGNWAKFSIFEDHLAVESNIAGEKHASTLLYDQVQTIRPTMSQGNVLEKRASNKKVIILAIVTLALLFVAAVMTSPDDNMSAIAGLIFISCIPLGIYTLVLCFPRNVPMIGFDYGGFFINLLNRNENDRRQADEFIIELNVAIGSYLKKQLLKFNDAMPKEEKLNKLNWLFKNDLLTQEELDEQLQQIG